jgi:hypothetical protein
VSGELTSDLPIFFHRELINIDRIHKVYNIGFRTLSKTAPFDFAQGADNVEPKVPPERSRREMTRFDSAQRAAHFTISWKYDLENLLKKYHQLRGRRLDLGKMNVFKER